MVVKIEEVFFSFLENDYFEFIVLVKEEFVEDDFVLELGILNLFLFSYCLKLFFCLLDVYSDCGYGGFFFLFSDMFFLFGVNYFWEDIFVNEFFF